MKSELELLVEEIKENAKQTAINKVDEVRVMRCMLNDSEFKIGVYDKNLGHIADRCPREEAVTFIRNIIADTTGLERKEAEGISNKYEFTKRDANFLVTNAKDFISVYMNTGRKMNIIQSESSESNIFLKEIKEGTKSVPDRQNPGQTKVVKRDSYNKIICNSSRPKYMK